MSKPGSYIDDGKGNLTPNMADEAMAARAGKKAVEVKPVTQPAPDAGEDAAAKDSKKDGGKTK